MELLERVRGLLAEEGIRCDTKNGELSTWVSTGVVSSQLFIFRKAEFLKVLIVIPFVAPIYRRPAIAEAVCRANNGLHFGSFECDADDGGMAFRASLPIADGEPTREALRCLVLFSISIVGRYSIPFLEVAAGAAEAKAAIERAEASWREEAREQQIEAEERNQTGRTDSIQ